MKMEKYYVPVLKKRSFFPDESVGITVWIKRLWEPSLPDTSCGNENCQQGMELHKKIERYLNTGFKEEYASVEFMHFLKFMKHHSNLMFIVSEKKIESETLQWRGVIDALFKNGMGEYFIVDWKRIQSMTITYPLGNRSSMLKRDAGTSGVLQLNLYRIILEKEYGIAIEGMKIVLLHPDNDTYYVVDIPRLPSMLEHELLSHRYRQLSHGS